MAVIFACPECGATLKSAQALAAGTKIKCPKCQTVFALPERPGSADADEETRPGKQAVAAGKPMTKKAAPKPPPREEFAEYDDDDEDDVQRDEEEEVRPKKKKKKFKGKKKGPAVSPALIGGIAGVVLLLAVGGVLGWVWPGFLIKLGNEPLAYIPPNSTFIVTVDVETLIDRLGVSNVVDQYFRQLPNIPDAPRLADCKKLTGLELKELYNQVTFASNAPLQGATNTSEHHVMVIKSKVPFDRDKVVDFYHMKGKEQKLKGRTIYKRGNSRTDRLIVYLPTNQIIVVTSMSDSDLEPILASRGTKPLVSPETMGLVDLVRQNQLWAVAPLDANARQEIKKLIKSAPAGEDQDAKAFEAALPNAKGAGVWLAVENNQVKLSAGLVCADEAAAKKLAGDMQKSFDKETKGIMGAAKLAGAMLFLPEPMRPFVQQLIESIRFTTQANMAQMSMQVSVNSIRTLIQQVQNAGPGMFMGRPGGMMPGGPGGFQPGRPQPGLPPRGGRRPR